MAPRAPLTRAAATSPARAASPKAAPTHAGPAPVLAGSSLPSIGVSATGGAVTAAALSTLTSIDAMPRTAAPGAPPQATTDRVAVPDCTLATSNLSRNSRSVLEGSKTWKSFRASLTKSSTLVSPAAADARPRTVTWPANVVPGAGSVMFTVPASGPVVGQVLGIAPAGGATTQATAAATT